MVVKYWNVYYNMPYEGNFGIYFNVDIPSELRTAHNKRITFLGFNAIKQNCKDFYSLHGVNIHFNHNIQEVDSDKNPLFTNEIIMSNGYDKNPRTYILNDELEYIRFRIEAAERIENEYLIEMKVEYEF